MLELLFLPEDWEDYLILAGAGQEDLAADQCDHKGHPAQPLRRSREAGGTEEQLQRLAEPEDQRDGQGRLQGRGGTDRDRTVPDPLWEIGGCDKQIGMTKAVGSYINCSSPPLCSWGLLPGPDPPSRLRRATSLKEGGRGREIRAAEKTARRVVAPYGEGRSAHCPHLLLLRQDRFEIGQQLLRVLDLVVAPIQAPHARPPGEPGLIQCKVEVPIGAPSVNIQYDRVAIRK